MLDSPWPLCLPLNSITDIVTGHPQSGFGPATPGAADTALALEKFAVSWGGTPINRETTGRTRHSWREHLGMDPAAMFKQPPSASVSESVKCS